MSNRLAGETSPYLLQHADNPVDWWPWCEEALALARREDKPILLSIGYSACHWCHVMAHESFENRDVAALMNAHFVSIKVDREERPDLDQIYQSAHQLLARRPGGWPLTMFLSPDGTPFFGGTYFPPVARYGMNAFPEVLQQVAAVFGAKREAIEEQNAGVRATLQAASTAEGGAQRLPGAGVMDQLADGLAALFDATDGGFGGAPKFPHCTDLAFLWRRYRILDDARAGRIVLHTLRRMAEGGIYDQLGGGFCRYSVDDRWAIPHFEKMLYDNGPLIELYADAWAAAGDPLFARVVEDSVGWVLREMRAPEGGFYSALDADSEHQEGKFYVWDREAVRAAVGEAAWPVVRLHYGLDGPPNFEDKHWHLRVARPLEQVSESLDIALTEAEGLLGQARAALFALREGRVRPGCDDKVLTSWNALMIQGLARAGRLFRRSDWIDAASAAADFLRTALWRGGRLLATAKGQDAHLNAYLDDHAYLLSALLELMQARFRPADLAFAEALAEALLEAFEDRQAGGFFFTRNDHEQLILRPKSAQDNATPSGNGIAAQALQRLGHILGRTDLIAAAERALCAFAPALQRNPQGYASLMPALSECLVPPTLTVLRGARAALVAWEQACLPLARPDRIFLSLPDDLPGLPPALAKPLGDGPQAWICQGVQCLAPVEEVAALAGAIERTL